MKNYKVCLIIFSLLLIVNVKGQNFNDAYRLGEQTIDFDARTVGMGNSTIASFGNFSSSIINPAGLGTIRKNTLSLSFNSNNFDNSSNFYSKNVNSDRNSSSTNQFGLVFPLPTRKGSAVLAFGYNQKRDFNSVLKYEGFNSGNSSMIQDLTYSQFISDREFAWELGVNKSVEGNNNEYTTPINGKLYQSGEFIEEGYINNWVMSGAVEIARNLFVGTTLNILSGEYSGRRAFVEDDFDNNRYSDNIDPDDSRTLDFQLFRIDDVVDWDIKGWDLRLGLLYKINPFLNYGATIKFPTKYSIQEEYRLEGNSEFVNNTFNIVNTYPVTEYEISTPMEFSSGLSLRLPLIQLNASAKFIDYSELEFEDDYEKNKEIKEVFESTINWNFGAEFTLPYPNIKIRSGFIYKPSPFIGDDSDNAKKYFTAGVGFPIAKKLLFDFSYVHGWWKTYSDNYSVDVSRTYQDIKIRNLVLSFTYVFR